MSKKSPTTSKQQPSLTDPVYKGSCITLDYDTTVKNLCEELHKMFDYEPKSTVLKMLVEKKRYDASNYPNTKSAIEKLQKTIAQYESNKKEHPFYLVMFSLKSLLKESKKDNGMFSNNPLVHIIEEFIERNDGHMMIHAMEHMNRTNKALEVRLEAAMKSRERAVQAKDTIEVSFRELKNLNLDESLYDAEKGTLGHELAKLKQFVSKFRLIAIVSLQMAQAKIDSELVIGFLSDVQFQLLKDIHHSVDTSLFINDVIRKLTLGLSLLLNEVSDSSTAETLKIKTLYDQITDLENTITIQALFDQALNDLSEEGKDRVRAIFKRWNDCIDGVGKFSPKELALLCETVQAAQKEALVSAKTDHKPLALTFKETSSPGDNLMTIFKIVCNIKQVYDDHTFFDIEGRDDLRSLRVGCVKYFDDLRIFMERANVSMRKDKEKKELSALEGYKPEYDAVFKEVYDQIWDDKIKKMLSRSTSATTKQTVQPERLAIRETTMIASKPRSVATVRVRKARPAVPLVPQDQNAGGRPDQNPETNPNDSLVVGSTGGDQPSTLKM